LTVFGYRALQVAGLLLLDGVLDEFLCGLLLRLGSLCVRAGTQAEGKKEDAVPHDG
jgi:hypothetical protein